MTCLAKMVPIDKERGMALAKDARLAAAMTPDNAPEYTSVCFVDGPPSRFRISSVQRRRH